jgi:hypothetical protein
VTTYDGGNAAVDVVVTFPYVASFTPSGGAGARITIDMLVTGDITFQNPGNMSDGQTFILRLRSDGSSHTVSYGTAYRGSSDTPVSSFTLPANSTEYRAFKWNALSAKADYIANNKDYT